MNHVSPSHHVVAHEYGMQITVVPELESIKIKLQSILSGADFSEFIEKYVHNISLIYMIYWVHRIKDETKKEQQRRILGIYIFGNTQVQEDLLDRIIRNQDLRDQANNYVSHFLIPHKTVDAVIIRNQGIQKEVFVMERDAYPHGLSLPGGLIIDGDEDNSANIPAPIFATLRVAATKLFQDGSIEYGINNESGFYFVKNGEEQEIRIHFRNANGYRYSDNLRYITAPTDPRHLVDTIGYQCEYIGNTPLTGGNWISKDDIMNPDQINGGFILGHHRELVAHVSARNPELALDYTQHHAWIRDIINHPEERYSDIMARFAFKNMNVNTSFPELGPVVKHLLDTLFQDDINKLCGTDMTLNAIRDKTIISLRHCILGNRCFCPYLSTLEAIFKGITFFDLVARIKRGFYDHFPIDQIYEHNPKSKAYASYHMYRYEYRWNEVKSMLPHEIIIPTFDSLGATDLMKVRGVPIWFVGLSTDFLYVDEFEQSPEEFFMHDVNHSYRMILETRKYQEKTGISQKQFIQESNEFIRDYLSKIRLLSSDSEEEREIKKLKKIILFEIVHEDAQVFTKESIVNALQVVEGGSVPFEVPHINQEGYMEIVDTLDHGISPLSYVKNKLQHGFYDEIDAQMTQVVGQKYRTSDWIARAAYYLLRELGASPMNDRIAIDESGYIAYEWLLARTCSVGPDNIHKSPIDDPTFLCFHDGNTAVNPKRYQV